MSKAAELAALIGSGQAQENKNLCHQWGDENFPEKYECNFVYWTKRATGEVLFTLIGGIDYSNGSKRLC